jgi:hypothetical protein
MTSQSPRIYTYKITFEEVPYYYYGVHKEKKFGEYYMGSPVTHKWVWDFYTPKKQILEVFPFTDEGWFEAQEVEKRLIRPVYNQDKWCLNESCGGLVSVNQLKNAGKIGGKKSFELKIGVHGRSKQKMSVDGRIGGEKVKELNVGIFGMTEEQRKTASVKAGKKTGKILGTRAKTEKFGIFALSPEQQYENSKNGGKKGSLTTNSQKWRCDETGFITAPGALTNYQRKRNIDTSKRTRIS